MKVSRPQQRDHPTVKCGSPAERVTRKSGFCVSKLEMNWVEANFSLRSNLLWLLQICSCSRLYILYMKSVKYLGRR